MLLLLYVFFRLDEKLERIVLLGNLGWISWLVLPYLGNLCFLPIISILLDVFICGHGVAINPDDITYKDSVLFRDCYEECWQGNHIYYVCFSSWL